MTQPSVLVAAGCSWVAGRAIDTDPTSTEYDHSRKENAEFVAKHSFSGILQRKLGLTEVVFLAEHGTNNKQQLRALLRFIDTSRHLYSRIFVLWGITTIYRWEMYTATTNQVESVIQCRFRNNTQEKDLAQYYFSNFFNREYELEKLGNDVLLLNGYLNNLQIDHLFFNSFNSVTNIDLAIQSAIPQFYNIDNSNNDMLSLLCTRNDVPLSKSSVPFLNNLSPGNTNQYNNYAVKELQQQLWLDRATAHPTVKAHNLIAEELYDYILTRQLCQYST